MTPPQLNESAVEDIVLDWLAGIGWEVVHGPDISLGSPASERDNYGEVVLQKRLHDALVRLNPNIPGDAHKDAIRRLSYPDGASLESRNRDFHLMAAKGVTVEYRDSSGMIRGAQVDVFDFDDPTNNDWLAVNQFTVIENRRERRPDVVLFVNGLPLAIIELKNPTDDKATLQSAFNQLRTYREDIPSLFTYNEMLLVSDALEARIGTLTATWEWFKRWRTISGEALADLHTPQLQVMIEGACNPQRFLALIRDFIVFQDDGSGVMVKIMAGYHQFHAVEVAVTETLRAVQQQDETAIHQEHVRYESGRNPGGVQGDRRIGVVWHTQGSGKSLSMAFFAGRVAREPALENPTIVVLTDRNDLDDQLLATFSHCSDLIGQIPDQAKSRADLHTKLKVVSGGVIFTTIQKFFHVTSASDRSVEQEHPNEDNVAQHPLLSGRRNIVVIADEAHRSQYDFIDGFARHMRDALPNASFIGFTGTPLERGDASTRAVFGDYISIYDVRRAEEDGATVPIYYENRLTRLSISEGERPNIDPGFDEVTEGEEVDRKEKLKTKWAQLEAIVGSTKRVELIAQDIVEHFEARFEVLDGKGMVVCMSRRICVELYNEIVRLRPTWHSDNDVEGVCKIVMTGSASDPTEWRSHVRNKSHRKALAKRFRAVKDPLRIVLVRDMWLTGFNAPSLHTMYIDKPMRGHGLIQAITRVNRVFQEKKGGLVVDYLGLGYELKRAVATYTEGGGTGDVTLDQEQAVLVMQEKHEVCGGVFHGFDWTPWLGGDPVVQIGLLPAAQEHVLAQTDGKDRFLKSVQELSHAFTLAVPHEASIRIRDDVGFFQAVRAALVKSADIAARPQEELDHAVRQIVSRAVTSDEVIDIFSAAGLKKPDISIFTDEFLVEVKDMPRRNLAIDLLQKLLNGEIKIRQRKNVVQARSFAEMLDQTLLRYHNRAIESAQVIEELIQLAREMREANARGEELGLTEDELAFYDALGDNDSAVQVMDDETLRDIARELVESVRNNVTIDWAIREDVRAGIRVRVKRILRKHGYPPDRQEKATDTVLEQAEVLSDGWATYSPT